MSNLNIDLTKWGPLTVIIVALSLLAFIGGLVVVIVAPETLNFGDYLSKMEGFILALAGLAGGHALLEGAKHVGSASSYNADLNDTKGAHDHAGPSANEVLPREGFPNA